MCILVLIVTLILSSTVIHADDTRAASLGLDTTWNIPMPNQSLSAASGYISSNWYTSTKKFYGSEDASFMNDPYETNNLSSIALKIAYPAGSYTPTGVKEEGVVGGIEFFAVPEHEYMYNTALLSYDLAFDSTFDWVKGGKLPGIYGGSPGRGCSGGGKSTGDNCFSVRLMWRSDGAGEAYGYMPVSQNQCKSKQIVCNNDYGISFSRGVIQFTRSKWTRMEIYVKLNSGSDTNGILQVWQDGSLMINQQHIQYRSNDDIGISSIMFSTFFGGGSVDYASTVDTATYFKNIQYSFGNTPAPTHGNHAYHLSYTLSNCLFILSHMIYLLYFGGNSMSGVHFLSTHI
ncbi:hypothetical protein BDB01DRAFT_796002 [Pilobolus umbonatus]|nr:hypothetical protein BDB01DRAFT_796002 [Pilobolus umbonatus]